MANKKYAAIYVDMRGRLLFEALTNTIPSVGDEMHLRDIKATFIVRKRRFTIVEGTSTNQSVTITLELVKA